jgi:cyanophycinase
LGCTKPGRELFYLFGVTMMKATTMRSASTQLVILAAAALLAACGGGSGSGSDSNSGGGDSGPAPVTPTSGQLVEPVSGLRYSTSSGVSGTTDAQGSYSYRAGDTITFTAGKLPLGQITAAAQLTWADVAAATASDASTLNLAQLLLSLDQDANPANGVQISADTQTKLDALPATLRPPSMSDADLQSQVLDVVFGAGNKTLASEAQALNHALAAQAKIIVAGMPRISNHVIGGGVRNCSSFNGPGRSSNCAADWATILAQDSAFSGLTSAQVSFDASYVRPTFTYSITQANIDKMVALPTSTPTVIRSTPLVSLTAALNARLADTSKPRTSLSWDDFDGGKPVFADGGIFWNNSALADFDLVVATMCGTAAPVNGTQCTLSTTNINAVASATFVTASDRPKVVLILQNLQSTLGTGPIFYRRDATGTTVTPNFRANFQTVKLAQDGSAPRAGLSDGLNTLEIAALRETFVDALPATNRKIEARSVAFLSNPDSRDIYLSFVQAARSLNRGNTPTIGVLTSAAENPWADRDINVTALQSAGANVVYLPLEGGLRRALDENACQRANIYMANTSNSNSLSTNFHMAGVYADIATVRDNLCANNGAQLASVLSSLNGLFLAGGDQARHLETFLSKDASGNYTVVSPQLTSLRTRFNAGQLVVAGTSAGAAVQSGGVWKGKKVPMLGSGYSWDALANGYSAGTGPSAQEITGGRVYAEGGMGFFRYGVLDQHFSQRTREGRLVRATQEAGLDYGFGVDENTSLVVGQSDATGMTTMTVLGAGGVFIADVRGATASVQGTALYTISGVITHYISAGDKIEIDANGELRVILGNTKPVVSLSASAPQVTATQVQEYGSSNYLKLASKMGETGAASARGITEGSGSGSGATGTALPNFSVTLTRNAQTVFRVKGARLSYSHVVVAFTPCAGAVCTAP